MNPRLEYKDVSSKHSLEEPTCCQAQGLEGTQVQGQQRH